MEEWNERNSPLTTSLPSRPCREACGRDATRGREVREVKEREYEASDVRNERGEACRSLSLTPHSHPRYARREWNETMTEGKRRVT